MIYFTYGNIVKASIHIVKQNTSPYVSSLIFSYYLHACTYTGLFLGNDTRGSKIRFYESEGSDGVKVCVHKHMAW